MATTIDPLPQGFVKEYSEWVFPPKNKELYSFRVQFLQNDFPYPVTPGPGTRALRRAGKETVLVANNIYRTRQAQVGRARLMAARRGLLFNSARARSRRRAGRGQQSVGRRPRRVEATDRPIFGHRPPPPRGNIMRCRRRGPAAVAGRHAAGPTCVRRNINAAATTARDAAHAHLFWILARRRTEINADLGRPDPRRRYK